MNFVSASSLLHYNLIRMEPKFQSSFIPKGPIVSSAVATSRTGAVKQRSLLAFLATAIFTISVLMALGALGYKFYLNRSISVMKAELEAGRQAIEPAKVKEITRLNNRLLAAEELINNHVVLSPLFRFIEASTLKSVRFTELNYSAEPEGIKIIMSGEARGYTALALQADVFNKSDNFRSPVFSDIRLDDKGNVDFSFTAFINPTLVSYKREVEKLAAPAMNNLFATSTAIIATTTPQSTSTTTKPASTTSPQTR